jgi:outer membrane protein assembly factor BamB
MACYHGATGERAWAIDRIAFGPGPDDWRGLIGLGFVWDANNDGADDVLVMCNDVFAPINGRDGTLLATPRNWGTVWSGGIQMLDVDGDDVPEVLHANPIGAWGITVGRMDAQILWHRGVSDSARGGLVVPADTNGDGRKELGCVLHDGLLQCWDASTGRTKWTVPLDSSAHPRVVTAVDLDGDGGDEFLVLGANRLLYCFKEADGQGETAWTLRHRAGWADAQALDFDGDGQLELVATSLDGNLSVLE